MEWVPGHQLGLLFEEGEASIFLSCAATGGVVEIQAPSDTPSLAQCFCNQMTAASYVGAGKGEALTSSDAI